MSEPDKLDPETRQRFEKLVDEQVITKDLLASFMNSLEKRKNRKAKKEQKKGATIPNTMRIKKVTGISLAQSIQVWGEELTHPEKELGDISPTITNSIFNNPDFNFSQIVLQGLSILQIAQKFPDHNWRMNNRRRETAEPGHYLLSYHNPLVNLYPNKENEIINSKEVIILDLCLTVELLITLKELEREESTVFYRTSTTNGHEQIVCVGLREGKITFVTERIARHHKQMGVCLTKYESWMI